MKGGAPNGGRWILGVLALLLFGSLTLLYLDQRLDALPYESCENPVWSPDGRQIAWQRLLLRDGAPGLTLQSREVWTMDAAGGGARRVGSFGSDTDYLEILGFTRDNSRVVVDQGKPDHDALWLLGHGTPQMWPVGFLSGQILGMQDDRVCFARRADDGEASVGATLVRYDAMQLLDLSGRELASIPLRRTWMGRQFVFKSASSLSPDGRYLVYSAADTPITSSWFTLCDLQQKQVRSLQTRGDAFWWSQDSTQVALQRGSDVFLHDLDSGQERLLGVPYRPQQGVTHGAVPTGWSQLTPSLYPQPSFGPGNRQVCIGFMDSLYLLDLQGGSRHCLFRNRDFAGGYSVENWPNSWNPVRNRILMTVQTSRHGLFSVCELDPVRERMVRLTTVGARTVWEAMPVHHVLRTLAFYYHLLKDTPPPDE
ncbi:MAG: hypothetical protein ACYCW6_03780 [Candidatus Xenobia bacterium]